MAEKTYSYGTYSCCDEPGLMIYGFLCASCLACDVAKTVNPIKYNDNKNCSVFCNTLCCPFSICCCRDNMFYCCLSEIMDEQMLKKGIKKFPSPCGDATCCGAYCQLLCPCSASCTLCLMAREGNVKPCDCCGAAPKKEEMDRLVG